MKRIGSFVLLSAVCSAVPLSVHAFGISLSLNLPAPKVAVTQSLSPGAIGAALSQKGFRIQDMYRKGPAYAVTATGPSGNKVLLMVDGRSGQILGLNVLTATVKLVPETAATTVYIDDRHPFGAVVPAVVYDNWQRYDQPQWETPAPALSISASFAPFQYAVPQHYVHASPKTGRSFAMAPPKYRGLKLQDHTGQEIRYAETRADAADAEAAYQSERADEADFDRVNAEQDAADARGEAADANADAEEMARQADEADRRATEAEQQRDDVKKQLDAKNTANEPCPPAECGPDVNSPPDNPAPADGRTEQPPAVEPSAPPAEAPAEPAQPPAAEPATREPQQPVSGPEQQDQRGEQVPEMQPEAQPEAQPASPSEVQPETQPETPEAQPEPQAEPQAEPQQEQSEPEQQGEDSGGSDTGGGDDGN